jgi:hypothetical protein
VECLLEAKCDLIAVETVPSIKEADAILTLLSEYPDTKAWLSFSCKVILKNNFYILFLTCFTMFIKNRMKYMFVMEIDSLMHMRNLKTINNF